ncbi:MAG: hypothetical protein WC389_20890 [Lutibacter sp.]|jgi:NAD(P)H-dependent FMN reductase
MKVLAFSGNNSASSINQELVKYILGYLHNSSDISDWLQESNQFFLKVTHSEV